MSNLSPREEKERMLKKLSLINGLVARANNAAGNAESYMAFLAGAWSHTYAIRPTEPFAHERVKQWFAVGVRGSEYAMNLRKQK